VFVALAVLLAFTLTFERLGYIATSLPLMLIFAWFYGARRPGPALATCFFVAAGLLLLFRYGLSTVLPEGVLGIDQIF
jgi:hypothetical protein